MPLPKNTAAIDAKKDNQSLSISQAEEKIKEQKDLAENRDKLWRLITEAKTPAQYKKLIDETSNGLELLEFLEADNARTTILTSFRLSPLQYLKLKLIISESSLTDIRSFFEDVVEEKFNKIKK